MHNHDNSSKKCSPKFYEGKLQFSVKIYDNSAGVITIDHTAGGLPVWQ